jgi:hypothetical protein
VLVAAAVSGVAASADFPREVPLPMWGLTVDSVANLKEVVRALDGFTRTPTVRVVFDGGNTAAADYVEALKAIRQKAYVMGELYDSYDIKNCPVEDYRKRTREYWKTLKDLVDIWEVGNEVNGEWLGPTNETVAKVGYAARYLKERGAKIALTTFHYEGCSEPEYDMFTWSKRNLDAKLRKSFDYVLVSYYEESCEGRRPDWDKVFRRLGVLYPSSLLGFGEVGLAKPESGKAEYLRRYYAIRPAVKKWAGGYFWWFFNQDCVPKEKPLWAVLRDAIRDNSGR